MCPRRRSRLHRTAVVDRDVRRDLAVHPLAQRTPDWTYKPNHIGTGKLSLMIGLVTS